ncbi:TetR family transcriptional regulator [Pseudovibrio japonicus]|uniref:TetR family transcriptional regulator n=1 Tax=Pseudovibrio japonicus TaxID=366534 RepID=A0ABQ3EJD8_9HYPH|nr:TetR/AcrR family transcriptional regulator [Pseudovibrio japonicus]GHB42465.1 TetR family transcriptional regulator [Pseudovibrio japonicus]
MSTTKKTGRPRKFDKNEALAAAVNVFWAKGYDGASMKDLTEAMGINGPSLYSTFGDKRELYLQAIDSYAANGGCAPLVAFETEPNIELAVRAFMDAVIEYATHHDSGAKGCFLASSVSTSCGEVMGVQELLSNAVEDTDQRLANRFEAEKEKGTLPANFPSLERARLMFDLRQGHVFRARAGLSEDQMHDDLDYRARMILAKPGSI